MKRYGEISTNGGPKHEVETVESSPSSRSKDTGRPIAPVVTRVDTDPSQAHAWQNESSVRHVQDPNPPFGGGSNQNTPSQQQWQGHDLEQPQYPYRNGTPDSQRDNQRREYRNSGWGKPQNGGSVGVTGT